MADEQAIQIELDVDPNGDIAAVTEKPSVEGVETKTAAETKVAKDDPIQSLKKQYDELKAKDEARAQAMEASRRSEAESRARADASAREAAHARNIAAQNSFQSVEHAIAGRLQAADIARCSRSCANTILAAFAPLA